MNKQFFVVDQADLWECAQKMRANAIRTFLARFRHH